MVRFSQTLDDRQPKRREKSYAQQSDNQYYAREEPARSIDDIMYRRLPRPNQVQRTVYQEETPYEQDEVIYVQHQSERESIQPDYTKPELNFPPDQNIQFGVEYKPGSRPPVIGKNYTIRSNSIIYNDVVIGDNFRTGHNVVIRENTNIGDDVLIGTNTVIEGDVIIGNDVSIQSNVYIPTNSVIEDNVFIGPCACFTNDKYPVRINYELQGPKVRRGASIGGNTTFLSNVEVGEGSIVAAGAIVIHSVPPFYLAIGTPARIKPLPDHLKVPNRF